jgi:hypothetical protein
VFIGPLGGKLRRQNFRKVWVTALTTSGVRPVHFHDLRHTGNQFAADDGANLRERMEHAEGTRLEIAGRVAGLEISRCGSDLRKRCGGDEGTRTPNPCLAKAVLCQLSYAPVGVISGPG